MILVLQLSYVWYHVQLARQLALGAQKISAVAYKPLCQLAPHGQEAVVATTCQELQLIANKMMVGYLFCMNLLQIAAVGFATFCFHAADIGHAFAPCGCVLQALSLLVQACALCNSCCVSHTSMYTMLFVIISIMILCANAWLCMYSSDIGCVM